MKNLSLIIFLLLFACNGSKTVDVSNLVERGGLTYYYQYHSLFKGDGVKIPDTPFSGKAIKYWPTGEVQLKGIFKNGILIQSSFLDVYGNILESMEINGDTTISTEWYSNGQKRWENRTIDGNSVFVNRWHEDGTKRKEPFKWEKEALENDDSNFEGERTLHYIIKKPLYNAEKQDVLFFMHGHTENLWNYQDPIINQFGDNYFTVILQAPYELSITSNKFTWFDFRSSNFFDDFTANEEQFNATIGKVLFSIDKIIEKEKIDPKRIFVGGHSQGGIMACKLALEYPNVIDGFIAHNTFLPNVYQTKKDKTKYSSLRGLVINGEYDKRIDPINSKKIANTFLNLGVNIKSKELKIGHEFPKSSRDVINAWMAQDN